MGILSRSLLRQLTASAILGVALFSFVLFLQSARDLFGLLVRSSATPKMVAYLFALVFPYVLTFTLPVGVLVAVLLTLSRLSADNEVVGLRAAGIPSRVVAKPILLFSFFMLALTAMMTCWLNPWSIRETYRVINKLATERVTAEIQPRVFNESFPKTVLYVGDVIPGPVVRWRQVLIADTSPPEERRGNVKAADSPRVTVTNEALAIPDVINNRVQLSMQDGRTIELGADGTYNVIGFAKEDLLLAAQKADEQRARPFRNMDMPALWQASQAEREARIEFHQRLALPVACMLLALLAIPLGIQSRKGGRSGAIIFTVLIALGYYSTLISLIGVAKDGRIPVELAVWTPNAITLLLGLFFFSRLERAGDRDLITPVRNRIVLILCAIRRRFQIRDADSFSLPSFGLIIDNYVLRSFLLYFAVLLSSFILLTHVFTFFELLGDIVRNKIAMVDVFAYHFYLTPKLIYDATPVSILVATLVTFGVMSKQNEVTALKASGISLYRLSVPILVSALAISGLLFAFDQSVVPPANQIQDALRNKIKGRAVQTYLNPDRNWIRGEGCRIYNYKYLDSAQSVLSRVNVYEQDCKTFHIKQHIHAERARWEPSLKTWIFQDGWSRSIGAKGTDEKIDFAGRTATFPGFSEPPSYFLKEVKQEKQMTYQQLAEYIAELQKSGFDTVRLQVQYHKKFAVPVFAFIMALIAVPFAFAAGTRGAMAGVGASLGIAVAYWSVNQLFEQIGNFNQLPPTIAAWAPDVVFSLLGAYFLARLRS